MPRTRLPFFSRPKDKSLEAYKEWILSIERALTGKAEDTWPAEEWEKRWRAFYKEDEQPPDPGKPA
jgi:hypothetical protein